MERIDETLNDLKRRGIIAVIRCDSSESALEIAEAVSNGGVRFVEITMTVPGAVDVLSELSGKKDIVLGAGTVLDPETAALCIAKGARFIVSPALDAATVRLCNRNDVLCIPGIGSVTEALKAMELGARVVKLFPSEVLGPGFIEAVRRPLPGARIMPTGTVPLESLETWFKAGAFAVGVGGPLTAPRCREKDYAYIKELAKKFVEEVKRVNGGPDKTSELTHRARGDQV